MRGPAGRKTGSFTDDRRLAGAKWGEVWGLARVVPHTETQKQLWELSSQYVPTSGLASVLPSV